MNRSDFRDYLIDMISDAADIEPEVVADTADRIIETLESNPELAREFDAPHDIGG